jgi:F0F1-type ATP synthase assembly protein I
MAYADGSQERPQGQTNRDDTSLQQELGNSERPMSVSYGVVGGILLLGGAGFALDRILGTAPWLLLVGLFAGIAIGFYNLRRFIVSG